jgi:hypothetical protein
MKSKSLYEEYKAQFMASSQLYCCYCLEPQTSYGCCQENHFVEFKDLYEEDQQHIINSEIEMGFEGAKK